VAKRSRPSQLLLSSCYKSNTDQWRHKFIVNEIRL